MPQVEFDYRAREFVDPDEQAPVSPIRQKQEDARRGKRSIGVDLLQCSFVRAKPALLTSTNALGRSPSAKSTRPPSPAWYSA